MIAAAALVTGLSSISLSVSRHDAVRRVSFSVGILGACWQGRTIMLHVVLIEPEIPPNTGNICRLCLATGSHLHLVKPLGYSLDDRELKRAGLDYWKDVKVTVWENFEEMRAAQPAEMRFFFLTTKTKRAYWDAEFRDGDAVVFGKESKGLPEALLAANADRCLTIPMLENTARSLNLSTAAGVVVYEVMRQLARVR